MWPLCSHSLVLYHDNVQLSCLLASDSYLTCRFVGVRKSPFSPVSISRDSRQPSHCTRRETKDCWIGFELSKGKFWEHKWLVTRRRSFMLARTFVRWFFRSFVVVRSFAQLITDLMEYIFCVFASTGLLICLTYRPTRTFDSLSLTYLFFWIGSYTKWLLFVYSIQYKVQGKISSTEAK